MPMEEISQLKEQFDVVISSLAFHYVEDFDGVIRNVYEMLDENGLFIFSQENPLCTCHSSGNRWTRDEEGNKLHLIVRKLLCRSLHSALYRSSIWQICCHGNRCLWHRTLVLPSNHM